MLGMSSTPSPPTDNLYKFGAIAGLVTALIALTTQQLIRKQYTEDLVKRKIEIIAVADERTIKSNDLLIKADQIKDPKL